MKKIKGIIFDLDGVLIDSEKYQSRGWVEALKDYGIFLTEKDILPFKGNSAEVIEEILAKKFSLKIKKGELQKKRDEEIIKVWNKMKKVKLMPFAKALLNFAKKSFQKVGLASTGAKKEVMLKLKKGKILNYFDAILTRDDVKKGKPAPDIYLKTAKKLSLSPKECLVIEDTKAGLESAKLAGMHCFIVRNQFNKDQKFEKADKIFKNLKEIKVWLEKNL